MWPAEDKCRHGVVKMLKKIKHPPLNVSGLRNGPI
uniref:Uncharacterized protein n=1 Tax=Vitis vinifera TaxID=29760 RepID=F6HJ84_VITVI